MKKIYILTISLMLILNVATAQVPQGFKYQTAIRDNNGAVIANKLVAIKLSLLTGSANGTAVYSEVHNIATNDFGVANLNVGNGTVSLGNFSAIDWGSNTFFLKTEVDLNNGTNFTFMGSSQLLSVPYAMFAAKSANAADDKDKDSTNELQTISLTNNNLQLSKNGGSVDLTKFDKDSQQLSLNGNILSITKGNSIVLSGAVDLDADPTNEIQNLSLSKDTLKISKANYVVLPKDNDADSINEIQSLSVSQNRLSISKSNQVNIDADTSNEIQSLSIVNDSLQLSKANKIAFPKDNDRDSLNELQLLSRSNDTIFLSKGNFVVLPSIYNPVKTFSLNNINYNSNRVFKILDSGENNYQKPDFGNSILFDTLGNFYFAGSYDGNVTLGGIQLNSTSSTGFFLAKFNNLGIKQWVNNYPNVNSKLVNFIIDLNSDIVLLTSDHNRGLSTLTKAIIYKVLKSGTNSWSQVFQTTATWLSGNQGGTHKYNIGLCVDNLNNIYTVNTTNNINSTQEFSLFKLNTVNGSVISTIPIIQTGDYTKGWVIGIENIFADDSNNIYIQSRYNSSRTQNVDDNYLSSVIIRINNNGSLRYLNNNTNRYTDKIYKYVLNSFIVLKTNTSVAYLNLLTGNYFNESNFRNNFTSGGDVSNFSSTLRFNIQSSGFNFINDENIFPSVDGFIRNIIVETNQLGIVLSVKSILTRNTTFYPTTVIDNNEKSLFFLKFDSYNSFTNINGQKIGNGGMYLIE